MRDKWTGTVIGKIPYRSRSSILARPKLISNLGNGAMEKMLAEIGGRAAEIEEIHVKAYDLFHTMGEVVQSLTTSYGTDLKQTLIRLGLLTGRAHDFGALPPEKLQLAPLLRIATFRDNLVQVREALSQLIAQMENLRAHGGVTRVDPNGTVFTGNGNQFNLRSPLEELSNRIDQALESLLIISASARSRGTVALSASSRVLDAKAQEAIAKLDEINSRLKNLQASEATGQSLINQQKTIFAEAERLKEEISVLRRSATEGTSTIETAVTQATSLQAKAQTLELSVNDYQTNFTNFEALLQKRETDLQNGSQLLTDLATSLAEKSNEIEEIIGQAKQMLGGATIAGLSSAYDSEAKDIGKSLNTMMWSFYGSVIFLLASVAAALGLIPCLPRLSPLPTFSDQTPTGSIAIQVFAAFGSRALIILPALLFAAFTARQYASLFRLKHEYTHRYTAAASVHGFKQQAPQFEEEIATAVFGELLINPATVLDKEDRSPSPGAKIVKAIMDRLQNKLDGLPKV